MKRFFPVLVLFLSIFAADPTPPNISFRTSLNVYQQYRGITPDTVLNTGDPFDSAALSGSLPHGLTFNKITGILNGTPDSLKARTIYTVTAYNITGTGVCYDTITVNVHRPGPMHYASSPAVCHANKIIPDSFAMACSTLVLDSVKATSLPPGLACTKATGLISGIATTIASKAGFKIKAWNISGVDSCYDTISVVAGKPEIGYVSSLNAYEQYKGIAKDSCINTGGAADSFIYSPSLPTGLSLTKATGTISGTPTALQARAQYRVIAYNAYNTDTCFDSITINPHRPAPMYYASSPAICSTGTKFIYTWPMACSTLVLDSIKATSLPAGFSCAKATGTITGTPTTTAVKAGFKIKAWNISGVDSCYDTVTVVLGRPHISYKRQVSLQRGVALTPDSIVNVGGTPDSFSISAALPIGLTFSKTTGLISGLLRDTVYYVKAYNATDTNSTAVRLRYLPATQSFKFGF